MLREKIADLFKQAIEDAVASSELGSLEKAPENIAVEYPKNPEHGDRAISLAMKLARDAKLAPRQIAEAMVAKLKQNSFNKVDIAGPGFINLSLTWKMLAESIQEIHKEAENFGKLKKEQRPNTSYHKILLEYVSANPTGDLHVGHGRQAVYGSALASLLEWAGYDIETEFYVNDAGAQMQKLGLSVQQAILIQEGKAKEEDYPEDAYPLDSMLEFIKPEIYKEMNEFKANPELTTEIAANLGKKIFMQAQAEILKKLEVVFAKWYSETDELYDGCGSKPSPQEEQNTKVWQACDLLSRAGFTYEEEGALWFKAKDFGDERNRVLRKSDGYFTYLAGDLAYHLDKLTRSFDLLINVWGADHHGQEPSLRCGLEALSQAYQKFHPEQKISYDKEKTLEIPLIQMVALSKEGKEVKMSKRSGNIITVSELLEEVGKDALRFFLTDSQINNRMVFDIDLATKQDKDNPVFYVQYAHARCSSIVRNLCSEQINSETQASESPILESAELEKWQKQFKEEALNFEELFKNLNDEEQYSTRQLILCLSKFPEEISEAAEARAPHKITGYLKEVATALHQFYTHNRVINDNRELMQARVALVLACKQVLANGLELVGVSAPERM